MIISRAVAFSEQSSSDCYARGTKQAWAVADSRSGTVGGRRIPYPKEDSSLPHRPPERQQRLLLVGATPGDARGSPVAPASGRWLIARVPFPGKRLKY